MCENLGVSDAFLDDLTLFFKGYQPDFGEMAEG
jgi:hypothetical protein